MITSGILRYMSADNDVPWKILAQAAEAHRCKTLSAAAVRAGGIVLKPPREAGR